MAYLSKYSITVQQFLPFSRRLFHFTKSVDMMVVLQPFPFKIDQWRPSVMLYIMKRWEVDTPLLVVALNVFRDTRLGDPARVYLLICLNGPSLFRTQIFIKCDLFGGMPSLVIFDALGPPFTLFHERQSLVWHYMLALLQMSRSLSDVAHLLLDQSVL